jgi:hypothetical protein
MSKKQEPITVSMAGDVKPNDPRFKKVFVDSLDPTISSQDPISQILTELKKSDDLKAIKLSFSEDPIRTADYTNIFKKRTTMIPNLLLKRVRDTEELIGGIILPLKANQVSLFGRPRPNRFDIGFTADIKPELYEEYSDEQIEKIKREVVPQIREILLNCGKNTGLKDREKSTFSQFLKQIVEDVYIFGWWATEIRKDHAGNFHSFRAVDAGTIYYAAPTKDKTQEAENIRKRARAILSKLEGHRIPIEPFSRGDYTWVQVIEDQPYQVFTDEQLIVWSLNPSTDILRAGYPNTIIERIVNSIITHINLTTHNKMFFLNGRAARSVMVFKSDNLDDGDIIAIRQQMTNHINTPNAAWRMPVFGISQKDEISIQPLDGTGRDMEFQYLADLNKRVILAAFQVSPDEIAALSYLSRGTNSQSLAEANNEWKLLKSQEAGLRPLLTAIEDFLNERLLPKINPDWAKLIRINLVGLDADSPEKEATLLSQASSLYYTFNDILDKVEKKRVQIGGDFPMNAAYMQILEKYFTVGEILEAFQPDRYKDASKNPEMQYYINNPAWFQFQQMKLQQQQMQMQAQQMQAQQAQIGAPGQQAAPQPQQSNQDQGQPNEDQDLDSALSQLEQMIQKTELSKTEKELPVNRKEMLKRHKAAKQKIMKEFEKDTQRMIDEIVAALDGKKSTTGHDH